MNKDQWTQKELANIAGYSHRQIYAINRDLPEDKQLFVKQGSGYSLPMFVQHWVDYKVQQARNGAKDLDEIKAEHEEVKMEKTRLEVARMNGELVSMEDVRRTWMGIVHTVMQGLLRLPSKVAPSLMMMENPEAIASIIEQELNGVLNEIANTPDNQDWTAETEDGESVQEGGD